MVCDMMSTETEFTNDQYIPYECPFISGCFVYICGIIIVSGIVFHNNPIVNSDNVMEKIGYTCLAVVIYVILCIIFGYAIYSYRSMVRNYRLRLLTEETNSY